MDIPFSWLSSGLQWAAKQTAIALGAAYVFVANAGAHWSEWWGYLSVYWQWANYIFPLDFAVLAFTAYYSFVAAWTLTKLVLSKIPFLGGK